MKLKTIKLLEEIIGEKFHDIKYGNDFLDKTAKHGQEKQKKTKGTTSKLKIFEHQRTLKTVRKGNPQNGRKSANHISDEGLISEIYREL